MVCEQFQEVGIKLEEYAVLTKANKYVLINMDADITSFGVIGDVFIRKVLHVYLIPLFTKYVRWFLLILEHTLICLFIELSSIKINWGINLHVRERQNTT